jgi:membrane protease YdiL (CAAX protease family)
MKKYFPLMMNSPEKGVGFAAFVYGAACFFSVPYLLLLFMHQMMHNAEVMCWVEIGYHVLNFIIVISLYRQYLSDSVFEAKLDWKRNAEIVAICAIVIVGFYVALVQIFPLISGREMLLVIDSMLPMTEMDLFWTSGSVVTTHPLWGTLCMVLVTPFVTVLIYYASGFATFCRDHVWLAYIMVAVVTALPRIANAATFWPAGEEMILYFARLPIHLLSCWTFQKTDNVWTPIALHMVVNLAACVLNIIIF